MVAAYIAALGGNVGPIVMQDIERAADLVMLAKTARAALLTGSGKVTDVVRLENAADRAVRRLNLPPPGDAAAAPVQSFADYVAGRHAASEGEED